MNSQSKSQRLKKLATSKIQRNPENPRLIFRQEEMETLMMSIAKYGIQVPLTVYQEGEDYFLIDGERRWRCANKLNLPDVPALVQEKPSEYENLVLMYNIHALREQWDYYTIASKLVRVIELYEVNHGSAPTETELSEETGLTRGQIRRCHLLINLPERFKEQLERELELPKSQQKISEDFFIEMERSLKTVTNRLPKYTEQLDDIRDTLVAKFRGGTISAVTDFRQMAKIATAVRNLGFEKRKAERALDKVFSAKSKQGIREAYNNTVAFEYDEQKAEKHIGALQSFLEEVLEESHLGELEEDLLLGLRDLRGKIDQLLKVTNND